MALKKAQIKPILEAQRFEDLFVEYLHWDNFDTPHTLEIGEETYSLDPIAHKRGFAVFHCDSIPDSAIRSKIETKLSKDIREHLIIYTDPETAQQRWQWVRRTPGQPLRRREHAYHPGQPELLISKLEFLAVDIDEEEDLVITDVIDKVRSALDVEKVTKKFYSQFKNKHDKFLSFIDGIPVESDAKWYASVMLNRLMFIYFIQKKKFLDGDPDYLRNRLNAVQAKKGKGKFHTFYRCFLRKLCHEVLDKHKDERDLDSDLLDLVGDVPYLNGGIFEQHQLEKDYPDIDIDDDAFVAIFDFFDEYEWHLDSRPNAKPNEINPDVLGYIFEKYINQKEKGAYYTKEDITGYISQNTIIPALFDKAQKHCKIAFEGETSVWNLLQADPDRYIYNAVRHGVS